MALPRFFPRNHTAVRNCMPIDKASLETVLNGLTVGVYLGSECDENANANANAYWIAEFLTNLLARLYPHIALFSETRATIKKLSDIAEKINPNVLVDEADPDFSIVIGRCDKSPKNAIYPWANGWVAKVAKSPHLHLDGPSNPYSSGAAAAFAAGELFKQVFSDYLQEPKGESFDDYALSLLDYSDSVGSDLSLSAIDLGEVVLAGIGAVGNPAVWALARHKGVHGKLWLVDPQTIELSNLQRYVLGTDDDAKDELPKVEMAKRELIGTSIDVQCFPGELESFADFIGGNFSIPTICVSVDNEEGRRNAQALLPKLAINGWTGDRCLGVSWHQFNENTACLSCLYQPAGIGLSQTEIVAEAFGLDPKRTAYLWVMALFPTPEELSTIANKLGINHGEALMLRGKTLQDLYVDIICGETKIEIKRGRRPVIVPLAYQSAVAGILMACELIKRSDSELSRISQASGYVIWEDIFKSPRMNWVRNRSSVSGCICSDPIYQGVYREKWM